MRDPREYTKSIICAHTFITVTYLVLGSVSYADAHLLDDV